MTKEIIDSLLNSNTAVDFLKAIANHNVYLQTLKNTIKNTLVRTIGSPADPIDWLQQAYRENDIVLVLGAGVSAAHKLPTWEALLQRLLIGVFDDSSVAERHSAPRNIAADLSRLYTEIFQTSPLIAARYLRDHYGPVEFEKAVRDALYASFTIDEDNELFMEIRNLCTTPTRNLNSVITYNYDDILETFLDKPTAIRYISVHDIGMNPSGNELPIYHVHGFLPSKGDVTSRNTITLSEDVYHKQYQDIYNWSNMVQINKFKDSRCMFIGTSFTDPNLRRLLDIAAKQRGDFSVRHVLIKKRIDAQYLKTGFEKAIETDPNLLGTSIDINDIAESLITVAEDFEENDALSFGVSIRWISDYKEIPQLLREIRSESSG